MMEMAKPTPRTKERTKPPKASMNVMKAWLPRIGNFFTKAVNRSRGGGRMKAGTLITSTRISHSTKSAMKNKTGSAAFFQENFTVYSAPTLMESSGGVKESEARTLVYGSSCSRFNW